MSSGSAKRRIQIVDGIEMPGAEEEVGGTHGGGKRERKCGSPSGERDTEMCEGVGEGANTGSGLIILEGLSEG